MNIISLHPIDKEVSAVSLFKGELGSATAIQLAKDAKFKEHTTKTPALLLCIAGKVKYEDETGILQELNVGDYIHIVPLVTHWLNAALPSQLILMK